MVSLPSPAEYRISTDRSLLDVEVVVGHLARSYWAANRPRARVETSLEHSLCFGLYHLPAPEVWNQVGFARVVSDYATLSGSIRASNRDRRRPALRPRRWPYPERARDCR